MSGPAKWYILHTISGSEKKVKQMIEDQVAKKNMSEFFEEIFVPLVEVPEIKRGKQVKTEKKIMPGYIFIKMRMTDDSWHLVKSVPKITGFLGSKSVPESVSEVQVKIVREQIESQSLNIQSTSMFAVGDKVLIIDGPFDTFSGMVEEVSVETQKLKVSVSIFGKATPIELNFNQVKKG